MEHDIERISGDQERRARLPVKRGRSILKRYSLVLARWLVERQTIRVGDEILFDFHEKRFRQLMGVVIKIYDHSYLVNLHERHLQAIQEVFDYREGNGCVCVSQKQCRKL
ncbi:hypothetical protein I6N95_09605 [Vagococcus sp. BWB3-3]|uniref:Uncharacterized protein n=1 Tax=Vagococcus allomyrinae TaxID=2794353 RepID=A0A940SVN8_9ENTE|nr:hypothetical protein [Vagococcus allomyrinae]MBP1041261.1 hypothetical protein [Vagococcus allomyrinae]